MVSSGLRYATIAALAFSLMLPMLQLDRKAFGDGLFMENLPPATVGHRVASLFVRINPPVLVSGSNPDAYLQLRLFDARNNETVKYTTFDIAVTKGIESKQRLMEQIFTSKNGLLTLHITPTPGQVQVYANTDPITAGWEADPGGNIKISGPLLLQGGLYHFHIRILGIDDAMTSFNDTAAPTFDSYLSVGDVSTKDISSNNQTFNSTLISYYDRANDFNFDSNKHTFTWSMPFDWNTTRIKNAPSFLVHEEVRIPKDLKGVGDTNSFNAQVNGQTVQQQQLIIDPFTYNSTVVVHYLLSNNTVLAMANSIQNKTAMNFELTPAQPVQENQTSGEWRGERSTVMVTYSPSQLSSGKQTTVNMQFIDIQGTGQKIAGDVHYDLTVKDMNGSIVLSKPGRVAKGGQDSQTLTFPSNSTYRVEAKITSIQSPNLPTDIRTDYARGIISVPEFPAGVLLATASILAVLIIGQSLMQKNKTKYD